MGISLKPNTNGPFGQGGFWSKLGNVAGHASAMGLGNALGGPLGGAGVNLLWNKLWGNQGNVPWHASGTASQPPSPWAFNNNSMPNLGMGGGVNPFFGGFGPGQISNLSTMGGFGHLFGGAVPPPVSMNNLPGTKQGFNNLNLAPAAPAPDANNWASRQYLNSGASLWGQTQNAFSASSGGSGVMGLGGGSVLGNDDPLIRAWGLGNCPDINMYVDSRQVKDLKVGDVLDCLTPETSKQFQAPILAIKFVPNTASVKLTAESGEELIVSETTPFTLPSGESVLALDMLDKLVAVDGGQNTSLKWSKVQSIESVGPRIVAHINLGGLTFAAGTTPDARQYSHNNMKAGG